MIRIHKPATAPTKLSKQGKTKAAEHAKDYNTNPADYHNGTKKFNFADSIYNDRTVKDALIAAQHQKCCFCERLIGKDGDVEHFRPKSAYSQNKKLSVPVITCSSEIHSIILRKLPYLLMNNSELQVQARKILDTIAFMPFEQCQPLTCEFESIPARPGIYAIRHRTDGLLYIGKTKSLRGRFSGGHKAFLWAWLDKYNDEDVRIAVELVAHWGNPTLLLELEAIILRTTEPPYNVQIPAEM
jgi:GIY-YIG catalytic domain